MPSVNQEHFTFTQSDGVVEVVTPSWQREVNQVSFATDSTTGTLAVQVKYHPKANPEVLEDEDSTAVEIDLTAPKTFQLTDKWVYSLIFTPTGVDASYTPLIASGDMQE